MGSARPKWSFPVDKDPVAPLTVHVPCGTVLAQAHFGQDGGESSIGRDRKSSDFRRSTCRPNRRQRSGTDPTGGPTR
jgi:hypothetical protein